MTLIALLYFLVALLLPRQGSAIFFLTAGFLAVYGTAFAAAVGAWRGRKYVTGTSWGLWLWTDVDSEYITRLHLVKTPWFALCVHWINKPDPEPYLHDHPVTFLSLVLKGWYRESRIKLRGTGEFGLAYSAVGLKHRFWNFIRASRDDMHSITHVSPGGAVTLCFMGPKTQEWGFHTPTGWIYWRDYYKEQRALKAKLDEAAIGSISARRWSPTQTDECPVEDALRGGYCESDEQLRTRIRAVLEGKTP